ncbi:MAG: universal stress protein [Nitrosopumilaceae archaeon]|jgi:nucleotide-binding universal stress UspA family protein
MNIYTTKQIKCSICGKFIGEADIGSTMIFPLCSKCNKKEKKIIKKGIDKILVPIDNTKKSIRALDAAIYFSKHLGATVTILQIIPRAEEKERLLVKDILKKSRIMAEKSIKKAKKYCDDKNIVANHRIVQGDESEAIVKFAKKSKYDLIIMGSSGKGVVKEMIFGSISNYVMHHSNVPVLTIKETSSKLDTKIDKPKRGLKTKEKNGRQGRGTSFSKMKQRAGLK